MKLRRETLDVLCLSRLIASELEIEPVGTESLVLALAFYYEDGPIFKAFEYESGSRRRFINELCRIFRIPINSPRAEKMCAFSMATVKDRLPDLVHLVRIDLTAFSPKVNQILLRAESESTSSEVAISKVVEILLENPKALGLGILRTIGMLEIVRSLSENKAPDS